MSVNTKRPKASEPFVMLPRDLLRSDAWREQGINCRRFIDFLCIEHLSKGGQENGKLKAPYRQLKDRVGIDVKYAAEAIREAERLGLVDCRRGGRRVATTYTLTWLPSHDGKGSTNRWRDHSRPVSPRPKFRNLTVKCHAELHVECHADG